MSLLSHTSVTLPRTQRAVKIHTTPHNARYNRNPSPQLKAYREKYVPKPTPRQYLCSDTRIEADYPRKAFIKAWNHLVSRKQRYLASIYNSKQKGDVLIRYNASVMYSLLESSERLNEFDTRLFRKTVERIEVKPPGKLKFLFKSGIKITI